MQKKALTALFFIVLGTNAAFAQLSTNPWVTANDAEEVEKIYQKNRLKNNNSISNYTPEATTVVDRSSAYIEIEEEETSEDESLFGKITSPFAKKEKKLISNTSSNRKALAQQRAKASAQQPIAETSDDSDFDFSLPGFSNPLKNLSLPKINATSLIQKFERASGINLKAIGKQFK